MGKHFLLTLALIAVLLLVVAPLPVRADTSSIEVVSSSAVSEFPEGIRFSLEARSDSDIKEIAVRFRIGEQTRGSYDYLDIEKNGDMVDAELLFRTSTGARYIPPGTIITYNFEITDSEGNRHDTEPQEFIYNDPRFEWEEISEGSITVAYHGPVQRRAEVILEAIVETVSNMGPLLGVDLNEPIRVTVYNGVAEMLPALPPGSATIRRELITEGQAFVDIGTLLVLGGGNSARGTAAHEVTHILTHRAGDSVFRNIPQWLDEGLAEYGNVEPGVSYDIALQYALVNDRLLPITSMQTLPGNPEDVIIFYGQARSIVQYMIDEFGPDKMRELMAALKSGTNVDDSIQEVYGISRIELENGWRDSLGAPTIAPPDLSAVLPTPIPNPTLELMTLDALRGAGASSSDDEQVEDPTPTAAPEPAPAARAEQPAPTPAASDQPSTALEPPSQEGVAVGCNAPLHGGPVPLELSSVALLVGLVGLGMRRRIRP